MLDVRRMKVLREVAAQGSFSAAAEALSFTQSAISQHVAALERETGARLVERGARGVRLTDAGRALVAHTEAILCRLDAAEEELAAIAGLRGGPPAAGLLPERRRHARSRRPWPSSTAAIPRWSWAWSRPSPRRPARSCAPGRSTSRSSTTTTRCRARSPPDVELTPLVEDSYDVILPRAIRSPSGASSRSPTWPTSRGSRPRSPTAAAGSPRRCAGRRGSSRAWPSRPTTRWPLRRWWPPAWASR